MPIFSADPDSIFMPAVRDIAAITQAIQAEITTTFDHGYVTGIICRIYVSPENGMTQINLLFAPITVTGLDTFLIDINTTTFDPFVLASPDITPAQCLPIGEQTDTLLGSFINVLPPI